MPKATMDSYIRMTPKRKKNNQRLFQTQRNQMMTQNTHKPIDLKRGKCKEASIKIPFNVIFNVIFNISNNVNRGEVSQPRSIAIDNAPHKNFTILIAKPIYKRRLIPIHLI